MDLSKTVSYIFEDDDWVSKIAITGLVSIGAGLSIFLVGFVFVAALLGWTIELIRNVLADEVHPMPKWDNFMDKVRLGVNPMIAYVVYFLPTIFVICVFAVIPMMMAGGSVNEDVIGLVGVSTMCVIIPILIIYSIVASLLYVVGLIDYCKKQEIGVFFKFGRLWRILTHNRQLTGQFMLYYFVIALGLGVVGSIPFVGSLAAVAFQTPVTAHLVGQYAGALNLKRKHNSDTL